MSAEHRCQVAGCRHEAVALLPAAPRGASTLTELAQAPRHPCCDTHERLVSDRYAAAVDWTLLKESTENRPVDRDAVQTICGRLRDMTTPRAQGMYEILTRLQESW